MLGHTVAEVDFPMFNPVIKGSLKSENTNYRSAPGIVEFNNRFFTLLASTLGITTYTNVVQGLPEPVRPKPFYIRFEEITSRLMAEGRETTPGEKRRIALDLMCDEVARELSSGFRPGDIAVLVRRRKEGVDVAEALLDRFPSLKIISEDALLLKNSAAVRGIIGIMRVLAAGAPGDSCTGNDTVKGSETVTGTDGWRDALCNLSFLCSRFEYLLSNGSEAAEALALACGDKSMTRDFMADVARINAMGAVDLHSLVEAIIHVRISDELRRKEVAYITAFHDMISDFCKAEIPSIKRFIKWWDARSHKLSIQPPASADALSVLTVHQAKGLQWPCVHLPFGSIEIYKDNEALWLDPRGIIPDGVCPDGSDDCPPLLLLSCHSTWKHAGLPLSGAYNDDRMAQIGDNLNVIYVAFTRPSSELIVSYDISRDSGALYKFADMGLAPGFTLGAPVQPLSDSHIETHLPGHDKTDADTPACPPASDNKPASSPDLAAPRELPDICLGYDVNFRPGTGYLRSLDDPQRESGDISDGSEIQPPGPDECENNARASDKFKAAERGMIFHSIMSNIVSAEDIDSAVSRTGRRLNLTGSYMEEASVILHKAFGHAADYLPLWFDPEARILNEQSIFLPEKPETLRPDRIIIRPDGMAIVLDYKFTDSISRGHIAQIETYASVLRSMGYRSVRAFLWYPFLSRIVER